MAKGTRGGRRSGSGAIGSITVGKETIEFEGTLKYGKKDPTLTASVRQNIENMEQYIVKRKVEYAYSVDKDGNAVGDKIRGKKTSVSSPAHYHGDGTTFTHNHPREAGVFGGTFSPTDIDTFVRGRGNTQRATTKEGTYSISRSKNFDGSGLNSYFKKVTTDSKVKLTSDLSKLDSNYKNGSITWKEYNSAYHKAFNSHLVRMHDGLVSGQKTFGYTYTLEKPN